MRIEKKRTLDMTRGVIWKQLLTFALPLLAGNLFQQLYNTVDGVVVGNFVGPFALGAVTSVAPALNMLIGFFVGFSTGATVVISQNFGAKNFNGLTRAIHTTITVTFWASFGLATVGVSVAPLMLKWMKMPPEVYPDALSYLRIYFAGVLGLMMYNIGAGILRAVGDSRRPLYFLIMSTVLNTALDVLFVALFKLGVRGAAYATILSQFISVGLVMTLLFRTNEVYKVSFNKMKVDWRILKKIFAIGVPAAFQSSIISFSNMFVQSYINVFGAVSNSGWGTYVRLDSFVQLPVQTLGHSITTFVGQNVGAENLPRIKKGINVALLMSIGFTVLISALLWIFAPNMIGLFVKDEPVINAGTQFLRLILPFSFLSCWNTTHAGALRGMGKSEVPMIIMLCSFVVFRQLYLFLITKVFHNVLVVAFGYPAGWIVCSIGMALYFKFSHWENKIRLAVEED